MINNSQLSRIEILIQQRRYDDAEKSLKDLLTADSSNTIALSLLSEVYLQTEKNEEALSLIQQAISHEPDNPDLFYTKARIELNNENYDRAENNIDAAIQLYSLDADYHAFYAHIKLLRKKYQQALDMANHALELDAENLLALNTRSTALLKLNKKEESFNTIQGALREDPNNSYTHSNYGWGLLEKGDHKKALEHFKEALKNDPNSAHAQAGMIEALKATNIVYRLFLKYAFFMSNLTAKYQWVVIIGFYFAFKVLRNVAENSDTLRPYLTPVVILIAVIAFSTWIIEPISNLFLRFNKYGRFLLSNKEKMSSDFVTASLAVCILGLTMYFIEKDVEYLMIAAFGFAMMVPCSLVFAPSKYKYTFGIYAAIMAITGLSAILIAFAGGDFFNALSIIFIAGFIAFQWLANFFIIKESNK